MVTFGDRLKELRLEKDLNQSDFGKIFSVEKGTVSNWENNNRFPDKNILSALADYFNVTTDYLLGRTNTRVETKENSKKLKPEVETIAAHLEDKNLTPHKVKMIKRYIDDLFDENFGD